MPHELSTEYDGGSNFPQNGGSRGNRCPQKMSVLLPDFPDLETRTVSYFDTATKGAFHVPPGIACPPLQDKPRTGAQRSCPQGTRVPPQGHAQNHGTVHVPPGGAHQTLKHDQHEGPVTCFHWEPMRSHGILHTMPHIDERRHNFGNHATTGSPNLAYRQPILIFF